MNDKKLTGIENTNRHNDGSSEAGLRDEKGRRNAQQLSYKLWDNGELGLRPPQLRCAAVGANVPGDCSIRRPAAHDRERNAEQYGDASTSG